MANNNIKYKFKNWISDNGWVKLLKRNFWSIEDGSVKSTSELKKMWFKEKEETKNE